MEPPSSINADKGKQAGQLSEDPLSCILSNNTVYYVIDSYDEENSCGRSYVCASLPEKQSELVYLGTLSFMKS